jgi:hypothetical protein
LVRPPPQGRVKNKASADVSDEQCHRDELRERDVDERRAGRVTSTLGKYLL